MTPASPAGPASPKTLPKPGPIPAFVSVAASRAAWIGRPPGSLEALALPGARYQGGDDFLSNENAFGHGLYLVDLQDCITGIEMVRAIRLRSQAGIVVLSPAPHPHFVTALEAGADAVVEREAPAAHVEAVMAAVLRRCSSDSVLDLPWLLHPQAACLKTPGGAAIELSPSDLRLLTAFAAADGQAVGRAELIRLLWGPEASGMDNALHASLYRLRKRVEYATAHPWPVHAVTGVGYEFRAPLLRV